MSTVEPIAKESRRERRLRRQREQGQEASAPAPDAQSKSNNINKHGPTKPPKTGPHSHSTSKSSSKNSSAKRRSKSTSRYASPSSSSGSPSTLLLSSTADFKGLESTSEIEEGEMDQPKAGPSRPRRSVTPPAASKNNSQASTKHGFDSQIDFIPFDTENTSAPLTRNGKDASASKGKSGSDVRADERRGDTSGKGKARDVDPPTREWDRGKPPLNDDRDRDRDRHARRRDRDADRHADGRGRKREHDRIDENGDTRRDETRRTAHYTESLKAPWTKDVDWDACNNVAEMYVLHHHLQHVQDIHVVRLIV